MNKIAIQFLIFFGSFSAVVGASSIHFQNNFYFENNKKALNKFEMNKLINDLDILDLEGSYKIEIVGYASVRGTKKNNLIISKERVEFIKNSLILYGIDSNKILCNFYGDALSKYVGSDEIEKLDRKVHLKYTQIEFKNIDKLLNAYSTQLDSTYKIDNQNLKIVSKRNVEMEFKENSFLDSNGMVVGGPIYLKVKDVLNPYDAILSNVSTLSDDKLLESGGMVYIEAYDRFGNKLFLDSSKKARLKLPTRKEEKDMYLFYGQKDSTGYVNWKTDKNQHFSKIKAPIICIDKNMIFYPKWDKSLVKKIPKFQNSVLMPEKPSVLSTPRFPYLRPNEHVKSNLFWVERIVHPKKSRREFLKQIEKNEATNELKIEKFEKRVDRYEANMNIQDSLWNNYYNHLEQFHNYLKNELIMLEVHLNSIREKEYVIQQQKKLSYLLHDSLRADIQVANYFIHPMNYKALNRRQLYKYYFGIKYYKKHEDLLNNLYAEIAPNYNNNLMAKYKMDSLKKMLSKEVFKEKVRLNYNISENGLIAQISNFGWINCDRFYEIPKDQLATINIVNEEKANIYIVFQSFSGVIKIGDNKKLMASLNTIPKNAKFKVIGLKLENGKSKIAVEEVAFMKGDRELQLNYKDMSISKVADYLSQLGSF